MSAGEAPSLAARAGLVAVAARVELGRRFAGSLLGIAWALAQPLLFLAAYLLVFAGVFRAGGDDAARYALGLLAGLLPCLYASDAAAAGIHAVTGNAPLVRNALFPAELLPWRAAAVSAALAAPSFALLVLAAAAAGTLSVAALALPLALAALFVFAAGLALGLSALNVLARDTAHAAPPLLFALVVLAPVAFDPATAPPAVRLALAANPLHPFVVATQATLVAGRLPDPATWVLMAAWSALALAAGRLVFRRLAPAFPDHL